MMCVEGKREKKGNNKEKRLFDDRLKGDPGFGHGGEKETQPDLPPPP